MSDLFNGNVNKKIKFDIHDCFIEAIMDNNFGMVLHYIKYYKNCLMKNKNTILDGIYFAIVNNSIDMLNLLDNNLNLTYCKSQYHFSIAAENKYYDVCNWLFRKGFPLPVEIKCRNMLDVKIQEIISEKNWWFVDLPKKVHI